MEGGVRAAVHYVVSGRSGRSGRSARSGTCAEVWFYLVKPHFPSQGMPRSLGALGEPWEALGQLWEGLRELLDRPVGLHIYQKLPINRPSGRYGWGWGCAGGGDAQGVGMHLRNKLASEEQASMRGTS